MARLTATLGTPSARAAAVNEPSSATWANAAISEANHILFRQDQNRQDLVAYCTHAETMTSKCRPATRRPGDPATRRPGDPATRRPSGATADAAVRGVQGAEGATMRREFIFPVLLQL
jgi:hypothetical protein